MVMDKIMRKSVGLVLLLFGLLLWGCEGTVKPEFVPGLVVNGQLTEGYPVDSIFVSWSEDITERYDDSQVRGAKVSLNDRQLLEYREAPGVYYLPDTTLLIRSGQTYHLKVEAKGHTVTSDTKVPQPLQISSTDVQDGDTVQYVPGDSWLSDAFFTLQWPNYSDPEVLIYRITSLAEQATPENFIVDDRAVADILKGENRDKENPVMWWSSNDLKYVHINWMFFNWRGWHTIIVSAMDQNYYNYRNGVVFGEQRPGEEFNQVVKGGYGLFCSAANDSIRVFIVE